VGRVTTRRTDRRPPRARIAAALAAVALLGLFAPAPASAHLRSGTVAVDYRATLRRPLTAAYSARIFQSDRGLTLTLRPGHVVVLIGYLGEPVFRLDRDGLWINHGSPTARVDGLLPKHAPRGGGWQLERGRRAATWHDARSQGLPAGVRHGAWSVPLIVDGHSQALSGELTRVPAPSLAPWLVLGVLLVAAAAGTLPRRRRRHRSAMGMWLGAAAGLAAAVTCIGFCLDRYASPGTWIVGIDALVFLAVGFGALRAGPQHLRLAAASGLGLVALAVGLLDAAIFRHAIVLAALPGVVVRLCVTVAIAGGLAAAGLGCLHYAETLVAVLERDDELAAAGSPRWGS